MLTTCPLKFKARVQSRHAKRIICVCYVFETGILYHDFKVLLWQKLANAFDEVLVRRTVIGNFFAQQRDYVKRVLIVPWHHTQISSILLQQRSNKDLQCHKSGE